MNPLETNQRVLMWLSGILPNESTSKRQKIAYIAFTTIVISSFVVTIMSGVTFIWQNISDNLEESLYSLTHTTAYSNTLYQSIITILWRHKLAAIFKGLAQIYKESKIKDV